MRPRRYKPASPRTWLIRILATCCGSPLLCFIASLIFPGAGVVLFVPCIIAMAFVFAGAAYEIFPRRIHILWFGPAAFIVIALEATAMLWCAHPFGLHEFLAEYVAGVICVTIPFGMIATGCYLVWWRPPKPCLHFRCVKCGYDLRGSLHADRCPECGHFLEMGEDYPYLQRHIDALEDLQKEPPRGEDEQQI